MFSFCKSISMDQCHLFTHILQVCFTGCKKAWFELKYRYYLCRQYVCKSHRQTVARDQFGMLYLMGPGRYGSNFRSVICTTHVTDASAHFVTLSGECHRENLMITLVARFMGANMGPIWGWQDPGGPHVGSRNLAIWEVNNGSGNGLVPSAITWTNIDMDLCYQYSKYLC